MTNFESRYTPSKNIFETLTEAKKGFWPSAAIGAAIGTPLAVKHVLNKKREIEAAAERAEQEHQDHIKELGLTLVKSGTGEGE